MPTIDTFMTLAHGGTSVEDLGGQDFMLVLVGVDFDMSMEIVLNRSDIETLHNMLNSELSMSELNAEKVALFPDKARKAPEPREWRVRFNFNNGLGAVQVFAPGEGNHWRWEVVLDDEQQGQHHVFMTHSQYLHLLDHINRLEEMTQKQGAGPQRLQQLHYLPPNNNPHCLHRGPDNYHLAGVCEFGHFGACHYPLDHQSALCPEMVERQNLPNKEMVADRLRRVLLGLLGNPNCPVCEGMGIKRVELPASALRREDVPPEWGKVQVATMCDCVVEGIEAEMKGE